ncbi:Alpha/Beta hydrolase protein [Aspergillus granulosus]|uniref:Alpha/Beta hydrolase protein n=1 Tax=Aspergillus granulosus TaxID=176169 RepID=A0ABR4HR95_9EURO
MQIIKSLSILLAASFVTASGDVGLTFPLRHRDVLPVLKLPYGKWRAYSYNSEADVYTFRNIRYAAPPIGDLRWATPAPPEFVAGIQDGSYGHNCIPGPIPPEFDSPIFENITKNANEDCLFLDIYVPGKALKSHRPSVPVVVWIHGGAYVTGSKDQGISIGYFDGTSLIQRAEQNLIVVSINYRLGAFGFLAGEPLRGEGNGTCTTRTSAVFNAGLHDQRAALKWVQSYIHLLGGDANNVSAWGQSAGAGSIMHHLIAKGGTLDPLFKTAALYSPGFGTSADEAKTEAQFEAFAGAVGCPVKGTDALRCLRAANTTVLKEANVNIFAGAANPVPDGEYIQNVALLEYSQGNLSVVAFAHEEAELNQAGNTWPHLNSLIVSHVLDEGALFVPPQIPPNFIESYISGLLPPNSTAGTNRMVSLYESIYANSTTTELASVVSRDMIFTCNIYAAVQQYNNSWAFQYSYIDGVTNGTHGSDVLAIWYNPTLQGFEEPLFEQYQRYLTTFAHTGDPNKPRGHGNESEFWPRVDSKGEMLSEVLDLTNEGFEIIQDEQVRRDVCGAWIEVLGEAIESERS